MFCEGLIFMVPWLSICIPSYNRAEMVYNLVQRLISFPGDFEVCVFVDGSTDDTIFKLSGLTDSRLIVRGGDNRGRGSALRSSVEMARGVFVMIYDDDDDVFLEGLNSVLRDCQLCLPQGCVGFVYLMTDERGEIVGSILPEGRANFLALRFDEKVTGDKKEVVLRERLLSVFSDSERNYRRVPTSLYWMRLATNCDVICRNVVVGKKRYLSSGLSRNINRTKLDNPCPMLMLHMVHIKSFFIRRYASKYAFIRSVAGALFYATICSLNRCRDKWFK